MGAIRFSAILLGIIAFGVFLVAGLPNYPGVEHAQRAPRWASFGESGGSVIVPEGWQRFDPFTSATPWFAQTWFHELPPRTCRTTLLRSPDRRFEVFLIVGRSGDLVGLIERARTRYDDRTGARVDELPPLSTADGLTVTLDRATVAGVGTALLGIGERGDDLFVLNAGGPTESFELETVRHLIRQLRLPQN